MSILNNAIDSISLGIEDYQSSDTRRLVSCARNIFAGILLLFKHKLSIMSPAESDEVLIKQRIVPIKSVNGMICWQAQGKKTVDVQQIKERFQSLGVTVDWSLVNDINNYRNDVEHYYSSLSKESVRSIISDSFIIIRDFVRDQLDEDPLGLLGTTTWGRLTEVAKVYAKEKKECVDHIKSFNRDNNSLTHAIISYRCDQCGSGLIDVESYGSGIKKSAFRCRACAKYWTFESIAVEAICGYFGGANHLSIKDGGEPVTVMCSNCLEETYVVEEKQCLICGEFMEAECLRCSMPIPSEELEGDGYCSYCKHVMEEID